MTWRVLLLAMLLLCTQSSVEPPRMLASDAYIWKRSWTPALADAVAQNADIVRQWRVLTSETDAGGQSSQFQPGWEVLAASGRPVTIVYRIDGRAERLDASRIASLARQAVQEAKAHGVQVAGVEIDFDCATARLRTYAEFLRNLRPAMPSGLRLSITALPTWLSSPRLEDLIASVDETVLQVHAIEDPARGLFDPDRAYDWIESWQARDRWPFRVALPSYGARVDRGADGRIMAVSGETPSTATGVTSSELMPDPGQLAAFVRRMEAHPPANLTGLVWFRLPVDRDSRSWTIQTWRDVVQGRFQSVPITVSAASAGMAGVVNIVLANPGDVDLPLPQSLAIDPACGIGDGANGYALDALKLPLHLERVRNGLLRGHASRMIGWTRCTIPNPEFHAEP